MKPARFVGYGALAATWLFSLFVGSSLGQTSYADLRPGAAPAGSSWRERAVRRSFGPESQTTAGPTRVAQRWSPYRQTRPALAQANVSAAEISDPALALGAPSPEVIPAPEAMSDEPNPEQGRVFAPQMGAAVEGVWEGEACGESCDECGACWGDCGTCEWECGPWGNCYRGCVVDLLRNFTFFVGIHGFKGPVDFGQNGNFGFHEGLNFGAPLGDPWGLGYQLGFQAVHSNFAGFQLNAPDTFGEFDPNGRDQLFFTGGLFRRAPCGGLQGGVVFDFVHDSYYSKADLRQIRTETAIVCRNGLSELGYTGAYGVNRERFQIDPQDPESYVLFQPNDVFALFYRRHFTGGGQGRIWAGATGMGQAIIGGEATVPLGTSWALENNFVYVIPKNASVDGGQREETWSVTINLVWYPGRQSRCVLQDPFHPLFGVADNSAFLTRRGSSEVTE